MSELRSEAKKSKGSFAAKYALESFSWSGQVDQMIAVYDEALWMRRGTQENIVSNEL